jgi:hypothetical protein
MCVYFFCCVNLVTQLAYYTILLNIHQEIFILFTKYLQLPEEFFLLFLVIRHYYVAFVEPDKYSILSYTLNFAPRDNDIISERRLPQPRSEGLPARIALLGHLLSKTRSDQTATHSA